MCVVCECACACVYEWVKAISVIGYVSCTCIALTMILFPVAAENDLASKMVM